MIAPAHLARALNLHERAALRRATANGTAPVRVDHQAQCRLERWLAQTPFDRDGWLDRRLASVGVDRSTLLGMLDPTQRDRVLESRLYGPEATLPPWLVRLRGSERDHETGRLPRAFDWGEGSAAGFLDAFAPLIWPAVEDLDRRVASISRRQGAASVDVSNVAECMVLALGRRLAPVIGRTMVLRMHLERRRSDRGRGSEGEHSNGTEQRFRAFVESMARPGALEEMLADYPVLGRLVTSSVDRWADFSCELAERLAADWPSILDRFAPGEDPGAITAIAADMGDPHRGARSVCILTFASGWKLVYKPRSLAIDERFADLLDWLADRGVPRLRVPRVLTRGDDVKHSDYGWQEHCSHTACQTDDEAQRYFTRFGALLAVCHACAGADCHAENLIACGEHPVLVDLETLLHPRFRARETGAFAFAEQVVADSILGVGLLPRIDRAGAAGGDQRSGLGGEAKATTSHPIATWQNGRTDAMRVVRRTVPVAAADNRPHVGVQALDPRDFHAAIREGFTKTYRLLERHRRELLASDGPLTALAQTEVRVVLRPTRFYQKIFGESFHPYVLRDALGRDRLLDRLWFGIDDHAFAPEMERLIPIEHRDLWSGDIPYFRARGDRRDVVTSEGEVLTELLDASGLETAHDRLLRLGTADLRKQLWFLDAAVAAVGGPQAARWPRPALPPSTGPAASCDLLAAAVVLADALADQAYRARGTATWLTLKHERDGAIGLDEVGSDLYGGKAGIAFFFAHLHAVTGKPRFDRIARETVARVHREWAENPDPPDEIGAFNGWAGLTYVWTQLARLWRDARLDAEVALLVARIEAGIEADRRHDLIAGAAGAIVALAACFRMRGEVGLLDLIHRLGRKLQASAVEIENGVGWLGERGLALGGLAHGAGGIAWALAEAGTLTGEDDFLALARRAVRYENAAFCSASGCWRDRRLADAERNALSADTVPTSATSWCHGAAGIGMTRLRLEQLLDGTSERERFARDLDAAVAIVRRHGMHGNHSLCHGVLGSLDLLAEVSRRRAGGRHVAEVAAWSGRVLAAIAERAWLCGVPSGVEVPGLMTGIAGIGYGLLRLGAPERVPSVLMLQPLPFVQELELRTAGVFPVAVSSVGEPERRTE